MHPGGSMCPSQLTRGGLRLGCVLPLQSTQPQDHTVLITLATDSFQVSFPSQNGQGSREAGTCLPVGGHITTCPVQPSM